MHLKIAVESVLAEDIFPEKNDHVWIYSVSWTTSTIISEISSEVYMLANKMSCEITFGMLPHPPWYKELICRPITT